MPSIKSAVTRLKAEIETYRLVPRWVIDECRAEGARCDKSEMLEEKGP